MSLGCILHEFSQFLSLLADVSKQKFGIEENGNYTLGFVRLANWGLCWLTACEWVLSQ